MPLALEVDALQVAREVLGIDRRQSLELLARQRCDPLLVGLAGLGVVQATGGHLFLDLAPELIDSHFAIDGSIRCTRPHQGIVLATLLVHQRQADMGSRVAEFLGAAAAVVEGSSRDADSGGRLGDNRAEVAHRNACHVSPFRSSDVSSRSECTSHPPPARSMQRRSPHS